MVAYYTVCMPWRATGCLQNEKYLIGYMRFGGFLYDKIPVEIDNGASKTENDESESGEL
jgi:hypothetical protein